ncbi:MAG: LysR family transcriptional regulator [Synergistaceae bacterium]|nr:LysR family transcriptional regulator [Synergistaceae bacterium]
MTLQQLYHFSTIARVLNFHKAADILHITQPSLSNSIARLEKELGFTLFQRKGRHVELTKYGLYYSQQINPILEQLESITRKAQTLANSVTGHIDLAYNVPFGRKLIPHIARGFLDEPENHECTFHFHQASSHRIIEGLKTGRFDVGVCTIAPVLTEINYIPLMRQELVAIVPRGHELSERGSVSLSELVKYPYVDYSDDVGLHPMIHKILSSEGASPRITAHAPDEESIAALVSEGFGVSFVASIYGLKNFDVVILKVERDDCYRTIYMTHLKDHYLTPAVMRFIRYGSDVDLDGFTNNFMTSGQRIIT